MRTHRIRAVGDASNTVLPTVNSPNDGRRKYIVSVEDELQHTTIPLFYVWADDEYDLWDNAARGAEQYGFRNLYLTFDELQEEVDEYNAEEGADYDVTDYADNVGFLPASYHCLFLVPEMHYKEVSTSRVRL